MIPVMFRFKTFGDKYLKDLADKIHNNMVFTDFHIDYDDMGEYIPKIFKYDKPDQEDSGLDEERFSKIGLTYAHMEKSEGTIDDRYPVFSEFGVLTDDQLCRLCNIYKEKYGDLWYKPGPNQS